MERSPAQRMSFYAAILFGVAPIMIGIVRGVSTNGDYDILWMALTPSFFTAGLLAAAMGRRRTKRAVRVQAIVIFIVASLLAAATAVVFEATAMPGVFAVSAMFGVLFSVASVLVAGGRAGAH